MPERNNETLVLASEKRGICNGDTHWFSSQRRHHFWCGELEAEEPWRKMEMSQGWFSDFDHLQAQMKIRVSHRHYSSDSGLFEVLQMPQMKPLEFTQDAMPKTEVPLDSGDKG